MDLTTVLIILLTLAMMLIGYMALTGWLQLTIDQHNLRHALSLRDQETKQLKQNLEDSRENQEKLTNEINNIKTASTEQQIKQSYAQGRTEARLDAHDKNQDRLENRQQLTEDEVVNVKMDAVKDRMITAEVVRQLNVQSGQMQQLEYATRRLDCTVKRQALEFDYKIAQTNQRINLQAIETNNRIDNVEHQGQLTNRATYAALKNVSNDLNCLYDGQDKANRKAHKEKKRRLTYQQQQNVKWTEFEGEYNTDKRALTAFVDSQMGYNREMNKELSQNRDHIRLLENQVQQQGAPGLGDLILSLGNTAGKVVPVIKDVIPVVKQGLDTIDGIVEAAKRNNRSQTDNIIYL